LKAFVRVDITDTGSGIPESIHHKIFDPFFTTKERGKGTGLGLSTTQTIVLKHGGSLEFTTEIGRGTTFTILFPALSTRERKNLSSPTRTVARQGKGELVLLIDDEGPIRFIMKKALELGGYQALTAANGREGLAVYEKNRDEISLVITDMAMPEMDGPHAIGLLRRINPFVKILVMTGHDTEDALKESNLKPNGFLQKPFDPNKLINAVGQILNC
jgi:CheY-like chemotaxis protein